eukprot:6490347-Amphidinium_carterae.3
MSVDTAMGVIDTGAVNAVMGLETLLGMDERLRACGVGTIQTKTPPSIGGIGGGVVPLMGVMFPAVLESVPGILNAIVIPGGVPLLLPNPLLDGLEACLDLRDKVVYWQSCSESSTVHVLPSGHIGCSVIGDWKQFFARVPDAERFRRESARDESHDKHILELRARANSKRTYDPPKAAQYFDLRECDAESNDQDCLAYEDAWMPQGSSNLESSMQSTPHPAGDGQSLGGSNLAVNSRGRTTAPQHMADRGIHHCGLRPCEGLEERVLMRLAYVMDGGSSERCASRCRAWAHL